MMTRRRTRNCGFTIMEIVISVGLLAVVIPLVIALTAASGQASRSASDDTKAAFIARSVLQEIAEARSGSGQLIEGELDWPEFPVEGERYVFAVDIDGVLVDQLSTREYEAGSKDPKVAYLVSARGEEQEFAAHPDLDILSRVEILVEYPAAAGRENRRRSDFVQLMHPHD